MLILELGKAQGSATLELSVFSASMYSVEYDITLNGSRSGSLAAQRKPNRRAAASGTDCLLPLSVCGDEWEAPEGCRL